MTVVFFGSDPWFSPPIFESLVDHEHRIGLMVTKGEAVRMALAASGAVSGTRVVRGGSDRAIAVAQLEAAAGGERPDLIVVAAFGPPFLSEAHLVWPRHGAWNVHASLLPRWRGASPVSAAIAAGDKQTGVTIMQLTRAVDHGPVLSQRKATMAADDTRETLTKKLAVLGGELLVETIEKLANDQLIRVTQPGRSPTPIARRLTKEDGRIDWSVRPGETKVEQAQRIERFIRAVTPWPGAWTELRAKAAGQQEGKELVAKGRGLKAQRLKVVRAHLEGDRLVIDFVQLPGKQPIRWEQFAAGRPDLELF